MFKPRVNHPAPDSMQLYTCSECSYKTPSVRKLGRHKSVNHAGVKYRCEMCDFVTGYQSNYYRHRKQVHNIASPNSGQSGSPRKNASVKNLFNSAHAKHKSPIVTPVTHHYPSYIPVAPPTNFDSSAASASFDLATLQNLNFLFLEHILKFACPLCYSKFATEQALNDHVISVHSVGGGASVVGVTEEATPSKKQQPQRPYVCLAGCGGYKADKCRDYLHHLRDFHGQKFDIFYCDKCYYATKETFKLTKHYEVVHCETVPSKNLLPPSLFPPIADRIVATNSLIDKRHTPSFQRQHTLDGTSSFNPAYHQSIDVIGKSISSACRQNESSFDNKLMGVDESVKNLDDDSLEDKNLVIVDCGVSMGGTSSCSSATPTSPHTTSTNEKEAFKKDGGNVFVNSACVNSTNANEAIELPTEKFTAEEINDPDVKSRICSICNYNGKWSSEMIRHKRVHNSERPFKCKYCGRASKWKADMIRHIAKIHGIRVVSKNHNNRYFVHNNNDANIGELETSKLNHQAEAVTGSSPDSHTESDRGSCPDAAKHDMEHAAKKFCAGSSSNPSPLLPSSYNNDQEQQEQVAALYQQRLSEFILAQAALASSLSMPTPPSDTLKQQPWLADIEKYAATTEHGFKCKSCHYVTRDLHTFRAHVQKHENKKPYQCSSCGYRSNWSSDVHKHIRLKKTGHDTAHVIKLTADNIHETSPRDKTPPTTPFNQREATPPSNNAIQSSISGSNSSAHFSATPSYLPPQLFGQGPMFPASVYAELMRMAGLDPTFMGGLNQSVPPPSDPVTYERESDDVSSMIAVEMTENKLFRCSECPYIVEYGKQMDFDAHAKKHTQPKGIMCYKCAFCSWYSKKKPQILDHMRVHTSQPESYMAEVERNLITFGASRLDATPTAAGESLTIVPPLCSDSSDALDLSLNKRAAKSGRKTRPIEKLIDTSANTGAFYYDDDTGCTQINTPLLNSSKVRNPVNSYNLSNTNEILSDTSATHVIEDNTDQPVSIDPEAYVHAGEEALGNEQLLFADMVPKDIQKVSVVVEGQMRKMWQCRYCTHISKRRANIRMHEKKHFKPNAVGLLKCPQCNYKGDKRSLKVHYRSHTITVDQAGAHERIHCPYCPATFRQRQVFETHVAFHGGHNRYRCVQCSYAVPSQHQLTQHSAVHRSRVVGSGNADATHVEYVVSDEPKSNAPDSISARSTPSEENVCNSVSTTENLTNIKRKKLQCRFCPAKFSERAHINRHEQFHGANMKHTCQVCNYSVPFSINLLKHLRSHHNMNINSTISSTLIDQLDCPMTSSLLKQTTPSANSDEMSSDDDDDEKPLSIDTGDEIFQAKYTVD